MPLGRFFALYCAVLCYLALIVSQRLEEIDLSLRQSEMRELTFNQATLLSSRVEAELNTTYYLLEGLCSFIKMNNGISDAEFNQLSEVLFKTKPGLVNISTAPNLVIRQVYPIQGNEKALGLDYRVTPLQRNAVMRVMETGRAIAAGPVDLVQGGRAIIVRIPVYIQSPITQEETFWGIVACPYDLDALYAAVDLKQFGEDYLVAIRGKDALGADGETFYGDAELFEKNPLLQEIKVLSGSWQLALIPKGGWISVGPNYRWILICTLVILSLLIGLGGLLVLYLRGIEQTRFQELEMNRAKARFYANMSHEVKTPLNAICGLAELIEETKNPKEIIDYAQVIRQSGESLNQLLDDVLSLGKREVEQANLNLEPIHLKQFVDDLIAPLRYQAEQKGVKLVIEPVYERPDGYVSEPSILRQTIWNLLSNAIKFTEEGTVTLTIACLPSGQLTISVSDTGIGISEDRHQKIFEPYSQVDESASRGYGGAGIGLSIVKRLVERLGGEIRVESRLGHGAVFTVVLPPIESEA